MHEVVEPSHIRPGIHVAAEVLLRESFREEFAALFDRALEVLDRFVDVSAVERDPAQIVMPVGVVFEAVDQEPRKCLDAVQVSVQV